jgi:Kdo2-lipid IVA lauroyltransferase/acyltransferase
MKLSFLLPKYWASWLAIGLTWLIAYLPWCIQRRLGAAIGKLFFHTHSRRKIAQRNIELCFPKLAQQEQAKLVKEHFIDFGISSIETCIALWRLHNKRFLASNFTVKGLEHLDDAKQQNKGVVLVCGHLSSVDMASLFVRELTNNHKLFCTYIANKNPVMDYFINKRRHTNKVATIEKDNIRTIIKTLRQKNIVWMACDQDVNHAKAVVFAPFMGVSAATVTSPSRLAQQTNSIIMLYTWYRVSNKPEYELILHPPLANCPSDDLVKDASVINNALGTAIKKYPEQYWWVHKRFKTRPQGEAPLYD